MAELKYTKHLLGKVEDVFSELAYSVRYARGNFQSGYCLVENQKVAVINKFYETEGRINVLIDILERLQIEEAALSEKGLKTYKQIMKTRTGKESETAAEEPTEEADAQKQEE